MNFPKGDYFIAASNRSSAAFLKIPWLLLPSPGKPACCTRKTVINPRFASIVMLVESAPPWPKLSPPVDPAEPVAVLEWLGGLFASHRGDRLFRQDSLSLELTTIEHHLTQPSDIAGR